MFERYNDQARRAIFFARYAASQSGSPKIEAEHLLLGVVREAGSWISRFAPSLSIEDLRAKIPRRMRPAETTPPQISMPLTKECKNILSYAAEEAVNLNHRYIGCEHLLLAILREENCLASTLLKEAGLQEESLRERVSTDVSQSETVRPAGISLLGGREVVHALIDELPENMLGYVKEAIDRTVSSVRPIRPQQAVEGARSEGRVSTSRLEGGDVVVETKHVAGGHEIHLTERLRVSPDGTRLSYVQEIAGPKPDQKHKNTIEFDLS
jgi:hypothetical protein